MTHHQYIPKKSINIFSYLHSLIVEFRIDMASKYESPKTRSRSSKKASPIAIEMKNEAKSEISSLGEISDDDDSLSVDLKTKTLKFSSEIENCSHMQVSSELGITKNFLRRIVTNVF